MNLYIGAKIETEFNSIPVTITVTSEYPWNSQIKVDVNCEQEAEFSLAIRIPDWCSNATIELNDKKVSLNMDKGYVYIKNKYSFRSKNLSC
ncbi:MAG: hypothetical protein ACRC5H_02660 [Treponemataceae bacterium]